MVRLSLTELFINDGKFPLWHDDVTFTLCYMIILVCGRGWNRFAKTLVNDFSRFPNISLYII